MSFEKLWVGGWVFGVWWVVHLDYNVSSGPFLSFEIVLGLDKDLSSTNVLLLRSAIRLRSFIEFLLGKLLRYKIFKDFRFLLRSTHRLIFQSTTVS